MGKMDWYCISSIIGPCTNLWRSISVCELNHSRNYPTISAISATGTKTSRTAQSFWVRSKKNSSMILGAMRARRKNQRLASVPLLVQHPDPYRREITLSALSSDKSAVVITECLVILRCVGLMLMLRKLPFSTLSCSFTA